MNCPECGSECGRDEADVGVGTMYGPYGCACGWSESSEYNHNVDQRIDSRGGLTLDSILSVRSQLAQTIPACEKCHNRAAVCRFDGVAYCERCAHLGFYTIKA